MYQLDPSDFHKALPLYRNDSRLFPLISAVLQNLQGGQVIVDEVQSPHTAFVATKFGFCLYLGDENNPAFNENLESVLMGGDELAPSYLLWYEPSEFWKIKLKNILSDELKVRNRIRYKFNYDKADYVERNDILPEGFELRTLDNYLLAKLDKFKLNISSRFWSSENEVIDKSLGVCLVKDDEVASFCYAACVADSHAEVDIVTDSKHRGKGFASIVAKEFVRRCKYKMLIPAWDCFDYNASSILLAKKLGFVEDYVYEFYSFNIPLKKDQM